MMDPGLLYCDGCGELVPLPEATQWSGPVGYMRERVGPTAGRSTWRHAGVVVHECVDGEFLPPDQTAPRSPLQSHLPPALA